MRDDRLVERASTSTTDAAVDPHAEEREVDHAQHGHAVLEQPEHHAAQRRAGGVVDRAVERVGDPHAPASAGRRRRPPRRRSRSRASRPRARASSPPRTRGRPRSGSPWPPCRSASAAARDPRAARRPRRRPRRARPAARGSHRERTRAPRAARRARRRGCAARAAARRRARSGRRGRSCRVCRRRRAARSRPRSTDDDRVAATRTRRRAARRPARRRRPGPRSITASAGSPNQANDVEPNVMISTIAPAVDPQHVERHRAVRVVAGLAQVVRDRRLAVGARQRAAGSRRTPRSPKPPSIQPPTIVSRPTNRPGSGGIEKRASSCISAASACASPRSLAST